MSDWDIDGVAFGRQRQGDAHRRNGGLAGRGDVGFRDDAHHQLRAKDGNGRSGNDEQFEVVQFAESSSCHGMLLRFICLERFGSRQRV